VSAGDREVLLMTAWDGLSSREAATALGCSRAAAKVRLFRAKRRLRSELDKLEHAEPAQAASRRLEECHDE
jgi:DNA-directed RNA polymerase specialized sigma24 family protein